LRAEFDGEIGRSKSGGTEIAAGRHVFSGELSGDSGRL
jgi:hypothetical protein